MRSIVWCVILWTGIGIVPAQAETARAVLSPTGDSSKAHGIVELEDTGHGVRVAASVEQASPGKHGFHIHENGDCSDAGKAAGGHYNPLGAPHGLVVKDGPQKAHLGDLGNIEIGPDGSGRLEAVLHGVSLTDGEHRIVGRSFILHEKEDDMGQPVGNAGARIACGIIRSETAPAKFTSQTEFFSFDIPAGWTVRENAKEGAVTATLAEGDQPRAMLRITYGETKLADESEASQKKALRAHAQSMGSGAMLKAAMPDLNIEEGDVVESRVGRAFAVSRRYTASDAGGAKRVFVYEHFIHSGLWFAVSYAYAPTDASAESSVRQLLGSFTFA